MDTTLLNQLIARIDGLVIPDSYFDLDNNYTPEQTAALTESVRALYRRFATLMEAARLGSAIADAKALEQFVS